MSESNSSCFLFEFAFTADMTSSNMTRSLQPQEPRQRNTQLDEGERQLQVNDKSWWPCEKTCSTAVDVATENVVSNIDKYLK